MPPTGKSEISRKPQNKKPDCDAVQAVNFENPIFPSGISATFHNLKYVQRTPLHICRGAIRPVIEQRRRLDLIKPENRVKRWFRGLVSSEST